MSKTKEELKEMFSTGKIPTGADFSDLIDESVQDLSGLQPKGSYATTAQVAEKADKTYVDTELGKKANSSSLAAKADKSVVDDLIARLEALEGAGS